MTRADWYQILQVFIPDKNSAILEFKEIFGKNWALELIVIWLCFQVVWGIIMTIRGWFVYHDLGEAALNAFIPIVIQDFTWAIIGFVETFGGNVMASIIIAWIFLVCIQVLPDRELPCFMARASLTACTVWLLFDAPLWGILVVVLGIVWWISGFIADKVMKKKI